MLEGSVDRYFSHIQAAEQYNSRISLETRCFDGKPTFFSEPVCIEERTIPPHNATRIETLAWTDGPLIFRAT